ncbi:hypothetical protein VTN96DRAFT_1586 [Rasamsonia emersonii]
MTLTNNPSTPPDTASFDVVFGCVSAQMPRTQTGDRDRMAKIAPGCISSLLRAKTIGHNKHAWALCIICTEESTC